LLVGGVLAATLVPVFVELFQTDADNLAEVDFRKLADPDQIEQAHAADVVEGETVAEVVVEAAPPATRKHVGLALAAPGRATTGRATPTSAALARSDLSLLRARGLLRSPLSPRAPLDVAPGEILVARGVPALVGLGAGLRVVAGAHLSKLPVAGPIESGATGDRSPLEPPNALI